MCLILKFQRMEETCLNHWCVHVSFLNLELKLNVTSHIQQGYFILIEAFMQQRRKINHKKKHIWNKKDYQKRTYRGWETHFSIPLLDMLIGYVSNYRHDRDIPCPCHVISNINTSSILKWPCSTILVGKSLFKGSICYIDRQTET